VLQLLNIRIPDKTRLEGGVSLGEENIKDNNKLEAKKKAWFSSENEDQERQGGFTKETPKGTQELVCVRIRKGLAKPNDSRTEHYLPAYLNKASILKAPISLYGYCLIS